MYPDFIKWFPSSSLACRLNVLTNVSGSPFTPYKWNPEWDFRTDIHLNRLRSSTTQRTIYHHTSLTLYPLCGRWYLVLLLYTWSGFTPLPFYCLFKLEQPFIKSFLVLYVPYHLSFTILGIFRCGEYAIVVSHGPVHRRIKFLTRMKKHVSTILHLAHFSFRENSYSRTVTGIILNYTCPSFFY